jgi:hypothetical protein
MSKAVVTKLFIGSAIAVLAGAVLIIAAVWIAVANDVFVVTDNEVVGVRGSGLAWWMLGLGIVGGVAVVGGMIGGLISWIGALLNTSQLDDRTWFLVLLLLGIFSFGFVAMIAYIVGGPDGTSETAVRPARVTT